MTTSEKVRRADSLLAEAATDMRREGWSWPADQIDRLADPLLVALQAYEDVQGEAD